MAETLYASGSSSGTCATPTNAVGTTSGTWTTNVDNDSWTHIWDLDNPVGTLVSSGTVNVLIRARHDSGNNPTIDSVRILESGTQRGINSTGWTISSTTGQDVTLTVSVSGMTNWDNAQIEIATTAQGGSPGNRSAVQVDYMSVQVDNFVAPTLVQQAYRWRTHANAYNANNSTTFGLAQNTALTTGANPDRGLALRFLIQETNGGSVSTGYKLQWNKNGGSWGDVVVDVIAGDPENATTPRTGWNPVEVRHHPSVADGASIASGLLTGGSGSFTAGSYEWSSATSASVTLSSQQTEIEWIIWYHLYDETGAANFADGDTINFRVVQADGTPLDTYTASPSLTVDVPVGYIGMANAIESPGRHGPYKDGNGNLYIVLELFGLTNPRPIVVKSTDGGDTWAPMDVANDPTSGDLEGFDALQVGDEIFMFHWQTAGTDGVFFHRFGTSDHATPANRDKWLETDTVIDNGGGSGLARRDQSVSGERFSNGDLVVAYTYDATNFKIGMRRRVSGTWDTSTTVLWNSTDGSWTGVSSCYDSTNNIAYFIAHDDTTGDMFGKRVLSDGTVQDWFGGSSPTTGTQIDANTGTGLQEEMNFVPPIYFNDGSDKIFCAWVDATSGDLEGVVVTVGSGGSVGTVGGVVNDANNIALNNGQGRMPAASIVRDTSGDLHAFFATESADGGNTVLFGYDTSTDDGSTWGTNSAASTRHWGSRINKVRANLYDSNTIGFYFHAASLVEEDVASGNEADANDGELGMGFSWFDKKTLATSATGTAAITEAADTANGDGDVDVAGTAATTEASDTVAGAGSVEVSGSAAITEAADAAAGVGNTALSASAAIGEADDSAAGVGSVEVSGSVAVSDADDTVAAAGSVEVTGSAAISSASDTVSATGGVEVTGSAAVTEAPDTVVATAGVVASGTAAITDADDAVAAAGTVEVSGSAPVSEADDVAAAAGSVEVSGSAPVTEAADTAAGAGGVELDGSAAVVEADDTAAGVGGVGAVRNASAAITEAADTVAAAGGVELVGSAAVAEADDTAAGSGTVPATSTGAAQETDDTASGAGTVEISGSGAPTEIPDTAGAVGGVEFTGTAAITDAADTAAAAGSVEITGTATITEAPNVVTAVGSVLIEGTGAAVETDDTAAAIGGGEAPGTGTAAIVEADDAAAASGTVEITGTAAIIEGPDTAAAIGDVETNSTAAIIEADDTALAYGYIGAGRTGTAAVTETSDTLRAYGYISEQIQPLSAITFPRYGGGQWQGRSLKNPHYRKRRRR